MKIKTDNIYGRAAMIYKKTKSKIMIQAGFTFMLIHFPACLALIEKHIRLGGRSLSQVA